MKKILIVMELLTLISGIFITTESIYDENHRGIFVNVDDELLAKLKNLYLEAESYKWDGYSKYVTNVSDGDGFQIKTLKKNIVSIL